MRTGLLPGTSGRGAQGAELLIAAPRGLGPQRERGGGGDAGAGGTPPPPVV
jgi:hypothetical protein